MTQIGYSKAWYVSNIDEVYAYFSEDPDHERAYFPLKLMTCLMTCLMTYLMTCLMACLMTFLRTYWWRVWWRVWWCVWWRVWWRIVGIDDVSMTCFSEDSDHEQAYFPLKLMPQLRKFSRIRKVTALSRPSSGVDRTIQFPRSWTPSSIRKMNARIQAKRVSLSLCYLGSNQYVGTYWEWQLTSWGLSFTLDAKSANKLIIIVFDKSTPTADSRVTMSTLIQNTCIAIYFHCERSIQLLAIMLNVCYPSYNLYCYLFYITYKCTGLYWKTVFCTYCILPCINMF